jgi:GST-like protein
VIDLYYWTTPNGHKVTMFLEEAGLEYTLKPVNIGRGEQFEAAFLKVSPNNKIPAIVDHAPADGKQAISVFESGAILLYLAGKIGRFIPKDLRGQVETLEWLMWQMGGLGPMAGQNHHFSHYAPEKIPYAIERYHRECRRLFEVLDRRLASHEYLAGDYSIADIANWSWVHIYPWSGIEVDGLDHLQRWLAAVGSRPAVQRGRAVPENLQPPNAEELVKVAQKILT